MRICILAAGLMFWGWHRIRRGGEVLGRRFTPTLDHIVRFVLVGSVLRIRFL